MNILLHGSYFKANFGDTLLVRLFADWLKQADGGVRIAVPRADEHNQRLVGADTRGLGSIRYGEGLLLCGGGYFGEPPHGHRTWALRAYWRHMWMIKRAQRRMPVNILGVGAGPITSRHLRRDVVKLFDAAEQVVVRDTESAANLKAWGLRRDPEVAVDAVVTVSAEELMRGALPPPPAFEQLRSTYGMLAGVHINVRPSAAELATAEAAVRWLHANTDYGIVLFNDGDTKLTGQRWTEQIKLPSEFEERVVRFTYDGRTEALIGMLAEMDLAITSKLHVGITRCALGKPVISIPVHSKTPRFYRQMGLAHWCIPHDTDGRVEQLHNLLAEWREGARPDFGEFEAKRRLGFYRERIASIYGKSPR